MLKALPLLCASGFVFAGNMGAAPIAESGLFVGLGGSYNSVKVDQYLNPLIGTTNIYLGDTLVATGGAGGPAIPFHNTQTTFAPQVQAGYLRDLHLVPNHDLFWGAKFFYQYLGITATNPDIISPQVGTLTPVTADGIGFSGRATIQSAQTKVNHQFALFPFIGQKLNSFQTYLGIGPTVFQTQSYLNDVTGFADIEGTRADITGLPVNFSSNKWLWGGIAQLGLTYAIQPTFFLDINYSYALSPHNKTNYSSTFGGSLSGGYTKSGTLFGTSTQYFTVQTLAASINKLFDI